MGVVEAAERWALCRRMLLAAKSREVRSRLADYARACDELSAAVAGANPGCGEEDAMGSDKKSKKVKAEKKGRLGKCERCKSPGAYMRPDPYESDVHGDDTKHRLCDACVHDLAMEV